MIARLRNNGGGGELSPTSVREFAYADLEVIAAMLSDRQLALLIQEQSPFHAERIRSILSVSRLNRLPSVSDDAGLDQIVAVLEAEHSKACGILQNLPEGSLDDACALARAIIASDDPQNIGKLEAFIGFIDGLTRREGLLAVDQFISREDSVVEPYLRWGLLSLSNLERIFPPPHRPERYFQYVTAAVNHMIAADPFDDIRESVFRSANG